MAPSAWLLACFAGAWWPVEAGQFLASRQRWGSTDVSAELVNEVAASHLANKDGHIAFQNELQSMYRALPKNEHGHLDAPTARYALHRFFLHKYGWHVKGLDPRGERNYTLASATISKSRIAQHIQSLFVRQTGLDLADLATFAAILSELMEDEVDAGLLEILNAMKLSGDDITDEDFEKAVEGYLARFILGAEEPVTQRLDLLRVIKETHDVYGEWPRAAVWSRDVVRTQDWLNRGATNPFSRNIRSRVSAIAVVRSMMHMFNHLSSPECFTVKRELMEYEVEGTGRVRLVDFYSNQQRRRESISYLRNLGVLDESDPGNPMLLIPNFITSSTNCLVDSSYYSSCCPDQCEHLLSHLERVLAEPLASPDRIAELVSQMPTDTVDAPRTLSSTLLLKLQAIADQNDGKVPLSGRLFAQWLHHAFPRECPYPQQSGSSNQLSQDDFMNLHDLDDVFVSKSDMEKQMKVWRKSSATVTTEDLPWDSVEELVSKHREAGKFGGLRPFMAFVVFVSMAWPLTRSSSKLMRGCLPNEKVHAHLV